MNISKKRILACFLGIALIITEVTGSNFYNFAEAAETVLDNDFVLDEEGCLINYKGSDDVVIIPDGVKSISSKVFSEQDRFKKIIMPDSITDLSVRVFENCTGLEEVVLSNNLTVIPTEAFQFCTSLKKVNIPSSVKIIGTSAFCCCYSLEQIDIPDSVTEIYAAAFFRCETIKKAVIPDSVTKLGSQVFARCNSLVEAVFPNSIDTIPWITFSECPNLEKVTIGDGITTIGNGAFSYCDNLKSIKIPDSVTTIDNSAFYNCWQLEDINIPKNIANIGKNAFGVTGIKDISIPGTVGKIPDDLFWQCEKLESIDFAEGLKEIGDNVFVNCKELKAIALPDSLESIGKGLYTVYIHPLCVIYCHENTFAHKYAEDKGFEIKLVEGDVSKAMREDLAFPTVTPSKKPAASTAPMITPMPTPGSGLTEKPENPDKGYESSSGINVKYHTQEEICNYVKNSKVSINDALKFDEEPITESPYSLGKLSDETLQSALKMLNQVRYIAGISDNVELSEQYNTLCQAGALANYANNTLSHYPVKPDGMSDTMYSLANEGAGASNIAWASWPGCSLNGTIVNSWMEDGDASNISRLGHRRWIINPEMGKTGFGAVSGKNGTYSSVYSFDTSNTPAEEYGVAWPAQNMPVEYFGKNFPWSVSMGYKVDENDVKVTLTRKNDGKTWNFSNDYSDGPFYVNNDYYGQTGCIIFRPEEGITYNVHDVFKVEITGLSNNVSYTVNFFNLNSSADTITPIPIPTPIPTQVPVKTPEASITPAAIPSPSARPLPSLAPVHTPEASIIPSVAPAPEVTSVPSFEPVQTPEGKDNIADNVKNGTKTIDKTSKAMYKVTGTGKNKTVGYIKSTKQNSGSIIIPDSVKINGVIYKVTSIRKNAFKNNNKIKSVKIGKNIISIGTKAFSGCKKLRNIIVSTNKLTATDIGKNAFSKGYPEPHVKANKSKCKFYKKIFQARGMSKKCKFSPL